MISGLKIATNAIVSVLVKLLKFIQDIGNFAYVYLDITRQISLLIWDVSQDRRPYFLIALP